MTGVQTCALPILGFGGDDDLHGDSYVPTGIAALRVYQRGRTEVFCHLSVPKDTVPGQSVVTCTLTLFDADGGLVAEVEQLNIRRVSRATLHTLVGHMPLSESLYQLAWQPEPAPADAAPAHGTWLIYSDASGVSDAIAGELRAREHTAALVRLGDVYAAAPDGWQIDPFSATDTGRMISAAESNVSSPLRGVVLVWPFATAEGEIGRAHV